MPIIRNDDTAIPPLEYPSMTNVAETVTGTAGSDVIDVEPDGLSAGDIIDLQGGTDTLRLTLPGTMNLVLPTSITGVEILEGSSGDDLFILTLPQLGLIQQINGMTGYDVLQFATTGTYNLANLGLAVLGIEEFRGSAGDDTINGTTGNDRISGDSGRDTLNAGAGNDYLDGGAGGDFMRGGAGNDIYIVDSSIDTVDESVAGSDGIDEVQSYLNFSLVTGSYVKGTLENLTLLGTANIYGTGNASDNVITGNSGNNTLTGNAGNDTLDGRAGADRMAGGAGNDTYVVDNAKDIVDERNGSGMDTIRTSITLSLKASTMLGLIENIVLVEPVQKQYSARPVLPALSLLGDSGNSPESSVYNSLLGDPPSGAKTPTTPTTTPLTNPVTTPSTTPAKPPTTTPTTTPTKTPVTTPTTTPTKTPVTWQNATGNSLDNSLTGNTLRNILDGDAGNDRLDGKGGADRLIGGKGNDLYVIDSSDELIEKAGEGVDTVMAGFSYKLLSQFENLQLTGKGNINGTGNDAANRLTGNSGNNSLSGFAGNDIIDGGAGNDILTGGKGRDHLVFSTAPDARGNIDRITDFNAADDRIDLENAIFTGLGAKTGQLSALAFSQNLKGIALRATDRIIYETDTGKLFYDADGTGSQKAIQFAKLDANLHLALADFWVF